MVSYCDLVCNSMTMNKLKHIFIFMLLFPDESSISTHNSTVRLCSLQETAQTGPIRLVHFVLTRRNSLYFDKECLSPS